MNLAAVIRLEEELLQLGSQCTSDRIKLLLAADFYEFGASGRVFDRAAILKELDSLEERHYTLADVKGVPLSDGVVLLTYRVTMLPEQRTSLRSSMWVWRVQRWQMLFHQGTWVADEAD